MTDITTIGQAVAVISACWAIIAGIGAWKREFIGKRRIELAELALGKFFEVKDAVTFIRNPWSSLEEGRSRERSERESADESRLLDRGYVVVERYQKKESVFADFNTLKYRCMATFGAKTEVIFTDTMTLVNSIFVSARMLATYYWPRQGRVQMEADEFRKHLDEMQRHEGVFWDAGAVNDPTRLRLQEIQKSLEAIMGPVFEVKPRVRWQRIVAGCTAVLAIVTLLLIVLSGPKPGETFHLKLQPSQRVIITFTGKNYKIKDAVDANQLPDSSEFHSQWFWSQPGRLVVVESMSSGGYRRTDVWPGRTFGLEWQKD